MKAHWSRAGGVLFRLGDDGDHLSVRFTIQWQGASPRAVDTPWHPTGSSHPFRERVDVHVQGFAYATSPQANRGLMELTCGDLRRAVDVFGDRRALIRGSRVQFTAPSPFERISIRREVAYGGECDGVPYFRNVLGTGFVIAGTQLQELTLPNLVEREDPLDESTLLAPTPGSWVAMLRPALFCPLAPVEVPRAFALAVPAPTGQPAREVVTGELPADLDTSPALHERLSTQEAVPRSQARQWWPGLELCLRGCLPGGRPWIVALPRLPHARVNESGVPSSAEPRALAATLLPEQDALSVLYGLEIPLAGRYFPAIHRRIPLSVDVESHGEIPFPHDPKQRPPRTPPGDRAP